MSAPVTTDSIAFVLDRQVQVLDFDSAFDFEAILYIWLSFHPDSTEPCWGKKQV